MELAIKLLAGLAVAQMVAMVLVVWTVCRRTAAPVTGSSAKMATMPREKEVAFYSGPSGTLAPPPGVVKK